MALYSAGINVFIRNSFQDTTEEQDAVKSR
jgi:hypothetical protein